MNIQASLQEIAVFGPGDPSVAISFLFSGHLYVLKVQYTESNRGFKCHLIHMTDNPRSCRHLGVKLPKMISEGKLTPPKSIAMGLLEFENNNGQFELQSQYVQVNSRDKDYVSCTISFLGSNAIITAITQENRAICRISRRV